MNGDIVKPIERIQLIAVRILATHPAGHGLCLVGGLRYRLLNGSAQASNDIDHVRSIEQLLDEQVTPAVTANLRAAGGAAMIWDSVICRLDEVLAKARELSS
jgi:hypothetical protein